LQMVPLETCLEQVTLVEQESLRRLTLLEGAFAERLRLACEESAAVTARPLLVDISALKAERAVLVRQRNVSRCVAGVAAIVAVAAVVWGLTH